MKVMLEIEYPNDKIFKADTLPIRIVDLKHGIYVDGKARIVNAIPVDWIKRKKEINVHEEYDYVRGCFDGFNDCIDYLVSEWEEENEQAN